MEWSNAVLGAIAGGLLTALGFIYKRRLENISVLNRTLYQLLTLYGSVKSSAIKTSDITTLILEVLVEKFPGAEKDPAFKEMEKVYGEMISGLLKKSFEPDEEHLLPIYLEAVENLSSVDPVLAYRLSCNAAIKRYLVAAGEKTNQIRTEAATELSASDMKVIDVCHEEASEILVKDVLEELKTDLLILSFRCGILQFISVVRRMRVKPGFSDKERDTMKKMMRSLLEKAMKSQQAET